MPKLALVALLLFLLYYQGESCFKHDKLKYEDLKEKILTSDNRGRIIETLFPTNTHSSRIVKISYQISATDYASNSSGQLLDYASANSGINFYWLSSSVHLCINVDMLYGLSLRTYNPNIANVTLPIDLTGLCSISDITEELSVIESLRIEDNVLTLCDGSIHLLKVLNDFTANLQMYALGQTSHRKDATYPEYIGYSVYYYQPNTSSKYCVIKKEDAYDQQRILLNCGSALLFIFTLFGFPPLFYKLHKLACSNFDSLKGSEYWMFIAWSVVIVSFIVNILILINNALVLNSLYYEYMDSFVNIFIFLSIFIVFCFGAGIMNFICCIVIIAHMEKEKFSKKFFLPKLIGTITESCCCCGCNPNTSTPESSVLENSRKCCPQCIALALGYAIFVHFLQLVSFHFVYVILGAVASPPETLSVLFDYITAYLLSVISVAIILKFMDELYFNGAIILNLLACILPLSIAGLALISAVACFTVYFYHYTEMMESNSKNEGLWGVVKTILPSLIVLFLGYCGHKLLRYIKRSSGIRLENDTTCDSEVSSSLSSHGGQSAPALRDPVSNNSSLQSSLTSYYSVCNGTNLSAAQVDANMNETLVSNSNSVVEIPKASCSNFEACSGQSQKETDPLLKKNRDN